MKCTLKQLYDFINYKQTHLSNEQIYVDTRFGYKRILDCDYTAYNSDQIEVTTSSNKSLIVSPEHLLFKNDWTKTEELTTNDRILTKDGYESIKMISHLNETDDLMDLQVDEVKEYYANGIVSHNSTVMDIIQFALFGKVMNKKLADLPNRLNKSLEVEIELIGNNRKINIKRGLEPNYFDVQIQGQDGFGDNASKLSIQETLESEYYGIPYQIFNNIISLSINDFKSFIRMTPRDKKLIIDKIFGLSIINQMVDELKIDLKRIKIENRDLILTTNSLTDQIERTMNELDVLSQNILEDTKDRKDEIEVYLEKLESAKELLKGKFIKLNELDTGRKNNIKDLQAKKYQNKLGYDKLQDKISLYKDDMCPTCGSDLTTEFHKGIMHSLLVEKNKINGIIDGLSEELDTLNKEARLLKEKKDSIRTKIQKIDTNAYSFQRELNELDVDVNIDAQTQSLEKMIKDTEQIRVDTLLKRKDAENKHSFYKIIEDALSDKGIKKMAIKSILPSINIQILELMKELNLNFRLVFDDQFIAKITHMGQTINPVTLSAGENKKLDFAVLIAITKLMKIKFPGLNLLFLDEIFSSLDSDSIHHVLKILQEISKELKLHIFVVNHAPLDNNVFDYKFEVNKRNNFSDITMEKIK